jgi:chemotaxis protein MotB
MQDGTPIIIRKKKSHKHGHHGGAWKVAYADFVTAMMAFFMVMWIMSLSDKDRQLVQAYFQDPVGFSKNPPKSSPSVRPPTPPSNDPGQKDSGNAELEQAQNARAEAQQVMEQIEQVIKQDAALQEMLRQNAIETKITPEGLQIELIESDMNGEVFFKVGSAEVQPRAREVMAHIAPVLAKAARPIVVEGHTDARPLNRGVYDNYTLSTDRAHAVRRLLRMSGVTESQIEAVKGYAAQKPRVPEDPMHFSNRRVTILLPFGVELPRRIEELPNSRLNDTIQGVFRDPFGN